MQHPKFRPLASSDPMGLIRQQLMLALHHHERDKVSENLPVDGMAFFSGLTLLRACMLDGAVEYYEDGIKQFDNAQKILVQPVPVTMQDFGDFALVEIAKVLLNYSLDVGMIKYHYELFGQHNKLILPKKTLADKKGAAIIPYQLTIKLNKNALGDVNIEDALQQNATHPVFNYLLSPCPATAFVVNFDSHNVIAFVTHAKMLAQFMGVEINKVHYDTVNALYLLKSYGIDINEQDISDVQDFDRQIAAHKDKGSTVIEILGS